MLKTITLLIRQHKKLVQYADILLENPYDSETLEIFITKLMQHLEKEDKDLYGPLLQKAKDNEIVRLTLDIFKQDIMDVSDQLSEFYKNYKNKDLRKEQQLRSMLISLLIKLKIRIRTEEIILFPLYKRLSEIK